MALDVIRIVDLVVQGILGINPVERRERQEIKVNIKMWVDTRPAAISDDIADAVNYRTMTKEVIAHIEGGEPMLVERLVEEIADICLSNKRVESVEVTVEARCAPSRSFCWGYSDTFAR